ncbi:MAG TPA: aldo/keto reductase [Mesorhizobium sp.]|jgi:D-threo-aldose 1-dehydrogenase|uniref:aldo/keto reductase n=1 Tax=Mesorhizobium sp. TaxID=1871066 RepID=UPI002DDD3BFF|nr:aldo/keto reductase [Mesorhizobium sp.]HEV2501677.1 aldo/keto reductase [Mesorhizobium sp.]
MMQRQLGRTDLHLSPVGIGGVPLGEIYERIPEVEARATLETAWNTGIRYYDTSPWYGRGLSELRFGQLLRQQQRDSFVLSTKVGRTFHRPQDPARFKGEFWAGGLPFQHRFDYTYDGIMHSYEQSLMRTGLNTIDMLLIHDLDVMEIGSIDLVNAHFADLERSGWRALESLRHYGEIKAVGAGVNIMGTIPEFLRRFDLDFFLVAMPFTLLDQDVLEREFPLCAERGVGIVVGSPYASGILATGTRVDKPFYNYLPATPQIIEKTRRIEVLCEHHAVPLKAAAYQFPLRHPLVASVVSGAGSPAQAEENARQMDVTIPEEFWSELKARGLLHPLSP